MNDTLGSILIALFVAVAIVTAWLSMRPKS
jgi:hypothetical protein